jgi:hypothetical protein
MAMTDQQVMAELRSDSLRNKARAAFSSAAAGIEQACEQRRSPGPIELRRMEFEAVEKIAAILGVTFPEPTP